MIISLILRCLKPVVDYMDYRPVSNFFIVPVVHGYQIDISQAGDFTHWCIITEDETGAEIRFPIHNDALTDQDFINSLVSEAIRRLHEHDGRMH